VDQGPGLPVGDRSPADRRTDELPQQRARPAGVAVFAVFGTLSLQQFKQLSVGLSIAVLLDATVVRGALLPSAMALLGDRNWYLPAWMSRVMVLRPGETSRTPLGRRAVRP
jgi:hypothetical protein